MWDFEKLSQKYTTFQLDKLRHHQPAMSECPICGCCFDTISYVFRPTAIYQITRATCSDKCKRIYAGKKNKKVFKEYICCGCNKLFTPHPKKPHQQYCNKQCRGLVLRGQSRPEVQRWVHKITPPRGSTSEWGSEWLDSLNVPLREHLIAVGGRQYRVDGFDPSTNTVYEYLGSFWHGNPEVYNPTDIHPIAQVPFGQLYEKTLNRLKAIEDAGFTVVVRWSPR